LALARRSKRASALDRRIKSLRRELGLVRDDMQALSRALHDPDGRDRLPRLRSGRRPRRAAPAPRDVARTAPAVPEETVPAQEPQPPEPPEPDLFSRACAEQPASDAPALQEQAAFSAAADEAEPAVREESERGEAEARAGRYWEDQKLDSRDRRFATYLVSGGLKTMGLMRQERRVLRRKAIFMFFFVAFLVVLLWNFFRE